MNATSKYFALALAAFTFFATTLRPAHGAAMPSNPDLESVAEACDGDGVSIGLTACQSWAGIISKSWDEFYSIASKAGCAVAGVVSENPEVAVECLVQAGKYREVAEEMIEHFNEDANNGPFTIGPRSITFDETLSGTITGTGGRTFIMPVPSEYDEFEVVIEETGGKGKTEVVICRVTPNGYRKLATHEFNSNSSEKKNKSQKWTPSFENAKGRMYQIHFDGKSTAKKFKYEITLVPKERTVRAVRG